MEKEQPRRRLTSTLPDIHRAPPHSVEAEQGVLGSMLISQGETIGECVERINGEYFYIPAHQSIYAIVIELWRGGQAFDLHTLTQILRDRNRLDELGGALFITNLFTFVPTAALVGYYLDIICDKYILRQIIANGTEGVRRAFEEQHEVESLLADYERGALAIRPSENTKKLPSTKDVIIEAIETIERQFERKGAISGLPTGFVEFDRMTSGLQPTDMIVIAGRPSQGKTAFAMNIAEHVAVHEKLAVGIFSLEMSTNQLAQRLLCSRGRVNLHKVRDGFLGERDFSSLTSAASKFAESRLLIDDQRHKLDVLVARARRWRSEKDIRLLVVDYLQLLKAIGFKPSDRQQEVTHISSALKGLAKDLGIPVIVVAQLNRKPEMRQGGRPVMSDLRESGSIEQDADLIGLLHRPEVYEEDQEKKIELSGMADLIIGKHRNGPIGEIPLTFIKEYTRFEDRARNVEE